MVQMFKAYVILVFSISSGVLCAQTAISGQFNLERNERLEKKVFLIKLDVDDLKNLKYTKPVAWSPVGADGSFSFQSKHISDKDAVYHLYVNRAGQNIKDTILNGVTFILSSSDKIYFPKGKKLFSNYNTTNLADQEWKKLQEFEAELLKSKVAKEEGAKQFKGYAKDSLRILIVKLIGIKQLEEKQLLAQDIARNPSFYLDLLAELKESEMPSENYKFLEKRLAFLTQELVKEKYALSKTLNIILGFLLLGLMSFLVIRRKKERIIVPLSRQEKNIQNLIVQGKTNKEIASELFISISTVKTHITNIYGKLKVSNRQELVRRAQN